MALTPSTMLPLGTTAPDFALPDTDGKTVRLSDAKNAKAILVMFICNHCPYVKHVRAELARLGRDYQPKGVAIFAISSNDVAGYPTDSPAHMKIEKQEAGYSFPYLYDATQEVAQAYRAACTPDFFLFDGQRKLAYRGQLDDTRPNRISSGNYNSPSEANGRDLRAALDALLAGKPVPADQKASMGCNIKWKPGHEPGHVRG
jgi:peroxiredoxin